LDGNLPAMQVALDLQIMVASGRGLAQTISR